MSVKPLLSICVPSRNRQIYFQKTIDSLRASLRPDVQFVFADNSDDGTIMDGFMAEVVADPRVVYLPSTGTMLSMKDNWERTAAAATGDFVVFIGDDDYVDPDVAAFIERILEVNPQVDAITWRLVGYTWPYPGRPAMTLEVPFSSAVMKIEQGELYRRMFGWQECRHVPTSGYSIYHSAVSRRLLERIRRLYGGVFFEHPVVDYDNAFKVICTGSNFVMVARPFGVMGSCPLSNSFAVGKLEDYRRKIGQFIEEAGRNFDEDMEFRKFPFRSTLGTTAAIGVAQWWFRNTYNIGYDGWEENFAKACAMDCQSYADRDGFDAASAAYRTAFELWDGGRWLKHFQPVYQDYQAAGDKAVHSGFTDTGVFVSQDMPVSTPAEMYDIIKGMVTPIDQLDIDPTGLKYSWQTEDKVSKMLFG